MKKCLFCKIEYVPKSPNQKYCCKKCAYESKKVPDEPDDIYKSNDERLLVKCEICGKRFKYNRDQKCCSIECNKERNRIIRKNHYLENKENILSKMKKYYKETREDRIKYQIKWQINEAFPRMLKKFQENGFKFSSIIEMNNARWSWGTAVKERDHQSCQRCGSTIDIRAHHIIPVSQNIKEALNIDNGITLCSKCHDIGNEGSIHNVFKVEYTVAQFWKWFESYEPEDEEYILLDEFMD